MAVCVYDRRTAPEQLITGLVGVMKSGGYLRINGKPVIGVDNLTALWEPGRVFDAWRRTASDCGVGDILICTCRPDTGMVSDQNVPEEETPVLFSPSDLLLTNLNKIRYTFHEERCPPSILLLRIRVAIHPTFI